MTAFETVMAIVDPIITVLAATFIAVWVNRTLLRQQSRTEVTVRVIVGLDEMAAHFAHAAGEYLDRPLQEKRLELMTAGKSLLVQFSFIADRRKLFGNDTELLESTKDAIDRLHDFCTDDCDKGDIDPPRESTIRDKLKRDINDRLHQVRRKLFKLQLACTGK